MDGLVELHNTLVASGANAVMVKALPVPGGSDSAATLSGAHEKIGNPDFGFVPGRGVFSHPHGPTGGAASLRQAWDAIAAGESVAAYAKRHPELAAALEAFGWRLAARFDILPG